MVLSSLETEICSILLSRALHPQETVRCVDYLPGSFRLFSEFQQTTIIKISKVVWFSDVHDDVCQPDHLLCYQVDRLRFRFEIGLCRRCL
jgi:hypothetical protein